MNKYAISAAVVLFALCGCDEKKPLQMAAPVVGVSSAARENIPLTIEVPAKITGSLEIQVRAQVGGILKSRTYNEGEYIQEGVKLFEIEQAPYQAALTRAQGTLAQAESELRRTDRDFKRMEKLHKEKAVSQKEYDDSLSAYERAAANLKVAEGMLHEAEINLGYTEVKAPISGIVRKEAQSVGNLISPSGESSLLTSMVRVCPLHANFSISGAIWANLAKNFRSGKIQMSDEGRLKVEVIMADGSSYPKYGKIIFVDSSEDNQTSSVSVKAEIPTDEGQQLLLPGQFVRVRIVGAEYTNALVIPATSLISTQAGYVVYVVKSDKTVEVRPVKAEIFENKAVINSGLIEGEVVVSEGIVKTRPGLPVTPMFKEAGDSSMKSEAIKDTGEGVVSLPKDESEQNKGEKSDAAVAVDEKTKEEVNAILDSTGFYDHSDNEGLNQTAPETDTVVIDESDSQAPSIDESSEISNDAVASSNRE